jgi:hypothetical protein
MRITRKEARRRARKTTYLKDVEKIFESGDDQAIDLLMSQIDFILERIPDAALLKRYEEEEEAAADARSPMPALRTASPFLGPCG